MTKPRSLCFAVGLLGLATVAGCQQTLRTGKTGNTRNAPGADGLCPAGQTVCGVGAFARCLDLQNDAAHCGACDNACAPGIVCAAGACQQTLCTVTSVEVADAPDGGAAAPVGQAYYSYTLLADVNGDHHLDLIEYQRTGPFRVSLGQAGGGFAAPVEYSSSDVLSISVTDANADGIDDLVVVSSVTPWLPRIHVETWIGHPDGHLTRANATDLDAATNTIGAIDVAVGDISGDGLPDLLMPSHIGSSDINVYLSDNAGQLHLSSTVATGSDFAALYVSDWNRDGSPDIAVRTVAPYSLKILYNRGDGTFLPPVDCGVYISISGLDIVVRDFNRDGWMDLALSTETETRVQVALGLGGCGFAPFDYYEVPGGGRLGLLRAADINGDGQLDLVTFGRLGIEGSLSDPPTDTVLGVLLGRGDGTFEEGASIPLGLPTSAIPISVTDLAIGEVTGDDRPDILISYGTGGFEMLRNTCQ